MPCGKKPLVKSWDKPRDIRTIKPSRYQQNEDSVKIHWKKVIKDLENSYQDDQFWDSQYDTVRELVSEITFERITKIFNLPSATKYEPKSETSSIQPSELYYEAVAVVPSGFRRSFSISDYEPSIEEELVEEEQSEQWSISSDSGDLIRPSRATVKSSGTVAAKQSGKSLSKVMSKFLSKSSVKGGSSRLISKSKVNGSSQDEAASSSDDLYVHPKSKKKHSQKRIVNPHFDMLYCNESETDMIKWNSKYKQKKFEVSASDEFSKKAEILTKQIAHEFYDWWVSLGNVEFKSEIRRPEDIEDLFQVWFDEHASRGIVLHPKTLPCVLPSIAQAIMGASKSSCPKTLKRQIAWDIRAETDPAHTMAFGASLPIKMKHIPPQNNTKEMWRCVKIPQDLRTMSAVWEDISHLTSTKAFQKWLELRPFLPMPPCLKYLGKDVGEKKQLFIVPSDFVLRDKSADGFSAQDLAIPVSQFSMEIKEVLSRLLND